MARWLHPIYIFIFIFYYCIRDLQKTELDFFLFRLNFDLSLNVQVAAKKQTRVSEIQDHRTHYPLDLQTTYITCYPMNSVIEGERKKKRFRMIFRYIEHVRRINRLEKKVKDRKNMTMSNRR